MAMGPKQMNEQVRCVVNPMGVQGMKLRIESDGTVKGTRVYDIATNRAVPFVREIRIKITPKGVTAKLVIDHVELQVENLVVNT